MISQELELGGKPYAEEGRLAVTVRLRDLARQLLLSEPASEQLESESTGSSPGDAYMPGAWTVKFGEIPEDAVFL